MDAANEILRDKYVLGLSKALKADDYPKALRFIDRLEKLGGDLPPAVEYFRGEAYFHTKRYSKADKALNRYLSKTGRKGRYYRKSLELLLTTEEKIQEIRNEGIRNEKDKDGNTALHRAARENDYEVVTKLIALGVGVNEKNKSGWTPLHTAAWNNAREVVALLIKSGADVDAKDKDGETPLHAAAWKNARDVAALFIEAGADVNARDKWGRTPLRTALDPAIRALLRRHGGRE